MRTIQMSTYDNTLRLMELNREGKAKPVGPVNASDTLCWLRTFGGKVIHIGLVIKDGVKV